MSGERLIREAPSIEVKTEAKPTPQTEEAKTPAQAENEKPEEAAASAEITSGDESTVEGEPKPKPKADGGFQRKINKLTARVSEREAALAERDRRIQELEARLQPATQAAEAKPEPPDPSKFTDWETLDRAKAEYISDLAAWKSRQELKKAQTETQLKQQQEKDQERTRKARADFEKKAMEVADRYEGLDEAIENVWSGEIPTSPAMAEFIMEVSDRGPELVFALNADPENALRISRLSPLAAAREMAKLEASLPEDKGKKSSSAPTPPKLPKGGSESPTKRLEDMSPAEYRAFRNEQDKKAGTFRRMINNG